MNILQIIFSIEKGGTETYLYNLLDNPEEDVNYFVICDHEGTNHEKILNRCSNVEIMKMRNVFDIVAARKVAKYCKENDIDIIQTHFLRENYISVLSKIFNPRVKIIWTTHLIAENNSIIKFFNRIFSKFVDRIVCVSKAVELSLIKEGISPDRIQVIYNGVDTDYFKPLGDGFIRDELNIEKDTLVLTTISRFRKEKGYSFLIEGLNELKKYIANFKALLVGEGEDQGFIREKVKEYDLENHVIFLGYREDIPEILAATDIYISPSENEAISFSIIEALSCGVPVVATEVGGVPEIFEKGHVGVLIPFGDKDRFAKVIVELYNNNQQLNSFKSNCRDMVIKNFSQISMLEKTHNLYYDLIKG
ncbi:glycosyltransferase [Tepidimicrobium xylanilyticum]|uniref:Glycosyltransferase involved in cell wall bisynthesis n=1 Tax=Tepidimicrobium xylanilyticum TaxID=1123352 RepID=A0A1H2V3Z3_9FIRM|nr:glycosyltransferase [Tepidimicrobium xylanilyticum]GMG96746.1 glycosyl transferase family 1 [Tepidimicrobium xylanilyticum]SDW62654.1 Glycosyltransferase involved in cell wall bisynthesis [Tepidimicrobium xylanilyticum]